MRESQCVSVCSYGDMCIALKIDRARPSEFSLKVIFIIIVIKKGARKESNLNRLKKKDELTGKCIAFLNGRTIPPHQYGVPVIYSHVHTHGEIVPLKLIPIKYCSHSNDYLSLSRQAEHIDREIVMIK